MLSSLFFLIFGSLGLYFGSEFLIDGAKSLAKKLKVSDLVIGLTTVSYTHLTLPTSSWV